MRREAGREERMKEPYREGLTSHPDPESCAGSREASGEALTGESAGQVLSCEICFDRGADAVDKVGRQYWEERYA